MRTDHDGHGRLTLLTSSLLLTNADGKDEEEQQLYGNGGYKDNERYLKSYLQEESVKVHKDKRGTEG